MPYPRLHLGPATDEGRAAEDGTADGQGLTAALEPLSSLSPGLLREWQQLADRAAEPNPDFSPQVLLPAARWLPRGDSLRLATVRDGERLLLAMPLLAGRYKRMPVPAFTTGRRTPVGTPLVDPDGLAVAPAALLTELSRRPSPSWLALEQVYLDGPVVQAFRTAAAARSASWVEHDVWRRPALHKRDQEDYLAATLSTRSAKSFRRRRQHLERDLGPVRLRDLAAGADPAAVRAGVEAFLALEAAGWKGRAGTALASDPRYAAFWRDSCQRLAETGHLRLWQLTAGDRVVAQSCDVRQGTTMFHVKIAYDEDLAAYSPGVQLCLEILHAFHLDPALTSIDPSTDKDAAGVVAHYPDGRPIGDVLIGFGPVGRLTASVTPLAERTWRRLAARAGDPD